MLAKADEAAPATAIIGSSTFGFAPNELTAKATNRPERIAVGNPFSPARLGPLVELVPTSAAPAQVVERGFEIYRSFGKRPYRTAETCHGQSVGAALWQEAHSLVDHGVVSVEDIDTAISDGPGLR